MQERTEDLKLVYQINHSYYPNFDSFISKVVDFIEVYYRSKEITKISDLLFREYEVNEITIGDIVNTFEVKEVLIFDFKDFPSKSDLIESVKNTCAIFYNKLERPKSLIVHLVNYVND